MTDLMDPVFLARTQFAYTIAVHIIFPAFTIGLASWLAVLEWRWLRTGNIVYKEIYQMWVKIFSVCFGMGVVSGIVMSYQFGTNWSVFSDKVANVIGPLLGYEVLTAFFLEASFLGIMLFGWGRVSKRMHFVATCVVATGTLLSAFWILSANSWMQTPQGFEIGADGLFYPTSWMEIIFNPSFGYRLMHMVTGAYLTTAFVVGGVGAYYLFKDRYFSHAKVMLGMAVLMAAVFAPLQLVIGDLHGKNTYEYQPIKVAAIEGLWETEQGAGFRIIATPNNAEMRNTMEIVIPNLLSTVLTGDPQGEVKGLNAWPKEEHPPVAIVFWSFRIMLAVGMGMILTGLMGSILYMRGRLFTTRIFQRWCMMMAPTGFIAVICGWVVTEVGRQPYTVYGVLKTGQSVSPVIPEQIAITLALFIVVYTLVFGAGVYYIFRLIAKGISAGSEREDYYDHSSGAAVATHLPSSLTRGSHDA